jgi:hypothetical protein
MPTKAAPNLMMDPGFFWLAPSGTVFPTGGGTAAGSIFTDAPSVTFVEVGATEDGFRFSYSQTIEAVTVAEFADPVRWRTTGRQGSMAFNFADYTLTNIQRVFNGGSLTTVSGTGATLISKWVPPVMGLEQRVAGIWQSFDATMRIFIYSAVQVNEVESAFQRAPDIAVLPAEYRFEVDVNSNVFEVYTAGVARKGI